jgi:NitT/TauT family transport system permease protein
MLFPAVVALLAAAGVGIGWGSVLLMLLGTQWYVLFNVVAGAMAIPADLREAARIYRVPTWKRFRALYLPAIFPYLVTGWVTAAGGAWNASIVSEYVSFGGKELAADGLGARISVAASGGDFPTLAASVAVMAVVVVLFNRLVWRKLHGIAEERFSLTR